MDGRLKLAVDTLLELRLLLERERPVHLLCLPASRCSPSFSFAQKRTVRRSVCRHASHFSRTSGLLGIRDDVRIFCDLRTAKTSRKLSTTLSVSSAAAAASSARYAPPSAQSSLSATSAICNGHSAGEFTSAWSLLHKYFHTVYSLFSNLL